MSADIGYIQSKVREVKDEVEALERKMDELKQQEEHMNKVNKDTQNALEEIKRIRDEIRQFNPEKMKVDIESALFSKLISSQNTQINKSIEAVRIIYTKELERLAIIVKDTIVLETERQCTDLMTAHNQIVLALLKSHGIDTNLTEQILHAITDEEVKQKFIKSVDKMSKKYKQIEEAFDNIKKI